jgi:FkbM family methyltransferase
MRTNFLRTVSIIYKNKFVNPYAAIFRHSMWAFRKLFNKFPYDLRLYGQIIRIPNRAVANGSGALINAMGYYDPNNMFLLKEIFQNKLYNSFFDVGANIGIYSLIVAGQAKSVNVYAFEPHPETLLLLQENAILNNLEERINCRQVALGDSNGVVRLTDQAGNPQNHILAETNGGGLDVNIQRADKICEIENFYPEVLKIDVEGFENQVLIGFGKSLLDVRIIFIECWNLPGTIKILCENAGFKGPYKIDYKNRRFVNENIHDEDWVFINPQALPLFYSILKFDFPGD